MEDAGHLAVGAPPYGYDRRRPTADASTVATSRNLVVRSAARRLLSNAGPRPMISSFLRIAGPAWALIGPAQPVVEQDEAPAGAPAGEPPAAGQLPTVTAEPDKVAPAAVAAVLPSVTDSPFERLPPPPAATDRIAERPSVAPPPAGPREEPAPSPTPTAIGSRPRIVRWVGPLGIPGLAVGAAGLGGVVAGVVLINKGTTVGPDADRSSIVITDYGKPGWFLYGAGMAATAIGAIALAIDVTVGRERRLRRVTVRPQVDHTHAGLQLRCRF